MAHRANGGYTGRPARSTHRMLQSCVIVVVVDLINRYRCDLVGMNRWVAVSVLSLCCVGCISTQQGGDAPANDAWREPTAKTGVCKSLDGDYSRIGIPDESNSPKWLEDQWLRSDADLFALLIKGSSGNGPPDSPAVRIRSDALRNTVVMQELTEAGVTLSKPTDLRLTCVDGVWQAHWDESYGAGESGFLVRERREVAIWKGIGNSIVSKLAIRRRVFTLAVVVPVVDEERVHFFWRFDLVK